jgi:hypothetical protein
MCAVPGVEATVLEVMLGNAYAHLVGQLLAAGDD